MECKIGVISGDGIGPEIVAEAKKVLDKIGTRSAFNKSACDTAFPCIGAMRQPNNHSESKYIRFIIHLTVPQYHQNAADTQT